MCRIAIMTDEVGWHTRQLQAGLRERGALGRCVDLAECRIDTTHAWHGLAIPGFGAGLPDAVLVRGIAGGSFEQVTRRLGVLHGLRELGVPVYNDARAIERSADKSMTSLLLHAAGIPTPPTWAVESPAQAQRIVMREAAAGHALVLKPLFGSQGRGLQLVGQVDGVHHPLPSLTTGYGALAYLQRFIAPLGTPGFDWRVLVVGGRALAAMRRVSAHWVHNVAQGAACEPAPLTPELAQIAQDAAHALELDYAGVDVMPSPHEETKGRSRVSVSPSGGLARSGRFGGPHQPALQVIEVNGVAAWQGLQRVHPFNIARALVDDLLDRRLAMSRQAAPRRA